MDLDIYKTYNGLRIYDDVNYKSFREFERRHPQSSIPPVKPTTSARSSSTLKAFERIAADFTNNIHRINELQGGESMQDARFYNTFASFEIYDSLQEIFKEWPNISGSTVEVKYLKPNALAEWQSVIYRCATMVKVLKTLGCLMDAHTKEYRFHYENKLFFKPTTYQFGFDPANYLFTVKTGQVIMPNAAKNWILSLHSSALEQLHTLLRTMRYELPQKHFEKVYGLYVFIKDKQTAELRLT